MLILVSFEPHKADFFKKVEQSLGTDPCHLRFYTPHPHSKTSSTATFLGWKSIEKYVKIMAQAVTPGNDDRAFITINTAPQPSHSCVSKPSSKSIGGLIGEA